MECVNNIQSEGREVKCHYVCYWLNIPSSTLNYHNYFNLIYMFVLHGDSGMYYNTLGFSSADLVTIAI